MRRHGKHSRTGRLALALLLCASASAGCKRGRVDGPSGPMSRMQRDRTIQRAIRSSSEGVILLPSGKADQVYELPRLNEIAQELRQPAAACFLAAAVQSMEPATSSDTGWKGVPDGQVKIRARIAPSGQVLSAEVLESGFAETTVPECVGAAIKTKKFPENETGNTHFIDIVYWVSLGMQAEPGKALAQHLRREQTEAAIRAKACFEGRVPEGGYSIEGLNLVGRDGATMANRVDQKELPDEVRGCVARAFRDIRLPAAPDSFVRPVAPRVRFDVLPEGRIRVKDEEWLRLVKLEERAQRDKRAADLAESDAEVGSDQVDIVEPVPEGESEGDAVATEDRVSEDPPPSRTGADPGKGGHKLDLSGRGGGG